jgi:hypothetical protein
MRRSTGALLAALLLATITVGAQNVAGPAKARATTAEIPFDSVLFGKMPAGLYMGEAVGVATNSKGHVFVIVRSGESRVFEFDQTGAFVKEFGVGSYGFAFAHAVRVDKDDNVWAVDEGTNIIQKFAPDGKLLMVLGKRPDPLEQLAQLPIARPTSAGIRRATSSSPTATATRVSSSTTRLGDSSSRWARAATAICSSARRTRWRSTRRATSTSPIAATRASSSSTTI